jgi:excisionase family DNA binding protein
MINQDQQWLTRVEAAKFLGVTKDTLSVWASTKRYNLPYYKCGKRLVKYKLADLQKFIEESPQMQKGAR